MFIVTFQCPRATTSAPSARVHAGQTARCSASFLAIGSAAPEIVINAIGVYKSHKLGSSGQSTSPESQREANSALQLGLSAIIGSGMIAFLLAPAICALGAKQVLKLKRRPLAKNILFYVLSLFALCWFFMDGGAGEIPA